MNLTQEQKDQLVDGLMAATKIDVIIACYKGLSDFAFAPGNVDAVGGAVLFDTAVSGTGVPNADEIKAQVANLVNGVTGITDGLTRSGKGLRLTFRIPESGNSSCKLEFIGESGQADIPSV